MNSETVRPIGLALEDGTIEPFDLADPFESKVEPMEQLHGILKALRYILEVREGESILYTAVTTMRRYKQLKEKANA